MYFSVTRVLALYFLLTKVFLSDQSASAALLTNFVLFFEGKSWFCISNNFCIFFSIFD